MAKSGYPSVVRALQAHSSDGTPGGRSDIDPEALSPPPPSGDGRLDIISRIVHTFGAQLRVNSANGPGRASSEMEREPDRRLAATSRADNRELACEPRSLPSTLKLRLSACLT